MKLVSMTYNTFIQCNFRFHPVQKKLNYSELIQTSSLGLQSTRLLKLVRCQNWISVTHGT